MHKEIHKKKNNPTFVFRIKPTQVTVWDCTKSCGKQFSKLSKMFLSKKLGHCLIIFMMGCLPTQLSVHTCYMYVNWYSKTKTFPEWQM